MQAQMFRVVKGGRKEKWRILSVVSRRVAWSNQKNVDFGLVPSSNLNKNIEHADGTRAESFCHRWRHMACLTKG